MREAILPPASSHTLTGHLRSGIASPQPYRTHVLGEKAASEHESPLRDTFRARSAPMCMGGTLQLNRHFVCWFPRTFKR